MIAWRLPTSAVRRAAGRLITSAGLWATLVCGALAAPTPPMPLAAGQPVAKSLAVAPGVFLIPGEAGPPSMGNGARNGNVGYLVGESGVLVWNTGVSHRHGQQVLARILSEVDKPIRLAVVSHAFQDVLFGWSAFSEIGIPVWMHEGAARLMQQRCQTCLDRLHALLGPAAMFQTRLAQPDRLLRGTERLTLIGRELSLIDLGHSSGPNDLMLFDHATGTLFSGATVPTDRLPDLHDGRVERWLEALHELGGWPVKQVVPDHGTPGTAESITRTLAYLQALDRQVSGMLERGLSLSEAVDNPDLPGFSDLPGFEEAHSRNVHYRYLQLESRHFR